MAAVGRATVRGTRLGSLSLKMAKGEGQGQSPFFSTTTFGAGGSDEQMLALVGMFDIAFAMLFIIVFVIVLTVVLH